MNKTFNEQANHSDETESFYSRWSKSKLQKRAIQRTENQSDLLKDTDTSLEMSVEPQSSSELNQEINLLCDKDMPDINSLDEDSDYSGFLSPGVSEELRKVALRKLFQGRGFNICDGLDDYDEEFTSFEKLGDIITADMRHQVEEEARRELQLALENEDVSDNVIDGSSEDVMTQSMPEPILDDTAEIDENELHDNENLS